MCRIKWQFLLCASILIAWMAGPATAEDAISDLPPYKLVRSLQYVQDTIVRGDLSALDMQKYLLGAIDDRLKKSTQEDFNDQRNVDAALIYTMSGGNSDTLAGLVFNDASGHFDIRITEALRMYMDGKSDAATKKLEEMVPEYKTSSIGPYLALVAGNAVALTKPEEAMKYFDWARLSSPGTIIEETALRRSVLLAIKAEKFEKALAYSKRYARRFILSPYAGQFADNFVSLAVDHSKEVTPAQVEDVMSQMEPSRQREVYLRMARKSALLGKLELAKFCAEEAEKLADANSETSRKLAELYSGMVTVPSKDVLEALQAISAIPDENLSDRDRNLRDAARHIAEQVLKAPEAESLTQAEPSTPADGSAISTDDPTAAPPDAKTMNDAANAPVAQQPNSTDPQANANAPTPGAPGQSPPAAPPAAGAQTPPAVQAAEKPKPLDPNDKDAAEAAKIDSFVTDGQAKLDAIDALLKKEP